MATTDATVAAGTSFALALVYRRCAGPLVFDLLQGTYTVARRALCLAALPAAYLLAAVGLACLPPRVRVTMLSLIILAWLPNLVTIYEGASRKAQPFSEIAQRRQFGWQSFGTDSRSFNPLRRTWHRAVRQWFCSAGFLGWPTR